MCVTEKEKKNHSIEWRHKFNLELFCVLTEIKRETNTESKHGINIRLG